MRTFVTFIGSRLLQGVLVVLGAVIFGYLLINGAGDPVAGLATRQLTAAQRAALIHQYGYDIPLVPRFFHYFGGLLRGDFGQSFHSEDSAIGLVMHALPQTGLLVGVAIAVALAVAVPVSIFSVLRRNSRWDTGVRQTLVVMQGIPDFWFALLLVLIFSVQLALLPSIANGTPEAIILPAAALSLPLMATLVRIYRGEMLEVLGADFVAALRARGLGNRDIVVRHAAPNALPALITFVAVQLGWLLGGTLVVETIFGWEGIGSLAITAVQNTDLPVLEALIIVVAIVYVAISLLADLLLFALDPRIRVPSA
ncbi:MAG TPA: ABC transporter permease [Conexibacter sp.]|nr:ABC transporter permease [Conexibacter sp.]